MYFRKKNILIISPEPWDHIFVSKHHYAIHLARLGNQVVFANPPRESWLIEKSSVANLRILSYSKFLKGLRWLPHLLVRYFVKKKFLEIEKFCQTTFDVIWSFDNSVFIDFSLLKGSINISHLVDLDQNFEMKSTAQSASLCLYNSEHIGHLLKKYNKRSYFINHGFNQPLVNDKLELPGKNTTKLLYAGNLNMKKLDWFTFYKAALRFRSVDFVLIGPINGVNQNTNPTTKERSRMINLPNVHLIGKIPAHLLANYYAQADALLLCYLEEFHDQQSNPHKMMEYLGSGKPIISTWTSTFEEHKDVLLMSKRNSDFIESINKFLSDKKLYDSEKMKSNRIKIALENTYFKQIEKISILIQSYELV